MIHQTAIIDPSAIIAPDVQVGPFTVIGPGVEIGSMSWIGPHVIISGPTKIGLRNKIFQFSSIGEEPQDKKFQGEITYLEIGNDNIFRECTTLSRGTIQGGGLTKIGNDNLFMAYVHIAHDCIVGHHTTFANNASLAGHVKVHDHANLGGFVGVHQFTEIGSYAFCAGGSIITKDVPPYVIVAGHPAEVYGLNVVGLKRHGFSESTIIALKQAYKLLYRQGLTVEEAVLAMEPLLSNSPEVQLLRDFVSRSERGIVR